jgi:predicted nuclease of predicted toxin-antitoxin system
VRFLVDAQLPPALVRWFVEAGHEAAHVQEVGLLAASDAAVWSYALEHGSIVVTKDEDFAARAATSDAAPTVVWLRVGNTSNRALRAWTNARLTSIVQLIEEGHHLIEVI